MYDFSHEYLEIKKSFKKEPFDSAQISIVKIASEPSDEIKIDDVKNRTPELNLFCNEIHLSFFHDSRVVNGRVQNLANLVEKSDNNFQGKKN